MTMTTTRLPLLAIALTMVTSSSAQALNSRVVLVPGADDVEARSALATVAGIEVVAADGTTELIDAAVASGFECPPLDETCWLRTANLGGYDAAVLVTATEVVVATARGSTRAPRFLQLAPAVRRAFAQRSALAINVGVADAAILVDGANAIDGTVVDDLLPGQHTIAVSAPAQAPMTTTIDLPPGAVVTPDLTLSSVATSSSGPSPLFIAGVSTLGVGVVAAGIGATVGAVNELAANGECHAGAGGPCDAAGLGWITAIGGGAVAVVGLVLTLLAP